MMRVRSPVLRAVYEKIKSDEKHRNDNHNYWYEIDMEQIPKELCQLFLLGHQDQETCQFLENCYEKSDWIFTQIGHSFAKSILSWFMSITSINGLLDRGSMYVFSSNKFKELLQIPDTFKGRSMIDLGAGDGKVTDKMAPYYEEVYVTEVSSTMIWRLQEKGYKALGIEEWSGGGKQYDLISCLNVLDRCDRPMSLLKDIHQSLRPGTGFAIIAVVLPFEPYVENSRDHQPSEILHLIGDTFEKQCTSFVQQVLEPMGFELVRFTRLPYLCEGDLHQSFYVLDDAVFVLRTR